MTDEPRITTYFVTEAEFLEARDRDCEEAGVTWEQLLTLVKPCGCCVEGPDILRRIFIAYKAAALSEEPPQ
jgi:hypothetical protein